MRTDTLSADHPERLAALRRYGAFRPEAQASHQRALELALRAVQAPAGLISLVGETSLRITAMAGHPVLTTTRRLPQRLELVLNDQFIQSTDRATLGAVNDLVGVDEANGFSFYASVPLCTADGQVIGNLCVLDRVPRALNPHQVGLLEDIAGQLIIELDLRLELWALRSRLETQEAHQAPGERILDSIHQAVIAENLDGTLLYWNAAAERLFGFTTAEMLGQPAVSLIPPEEHPSWQESMQHALSGIHTEPFEAIRLHKDGRRIPVRIGLSPIRGTGNRVIGIASLIERMTSAAPVPMVSTLEPGLRGNLESIGGAATLTQMLAITGHSGALQLGPTRVYLRSGRVIHIEHPHAAGAEAVIEALRLDRGYFEYIPDDAPAEVTLHLDLTTLALEAARRNDEAGSNQAGSNEASSHEASSDQPVVTPTVSLETRPFTPSMIDPVPAVQGVITLPNVEVALKFLAGVGGTAPFQASLEPGGTNGQPRLVLIGRSIKINVLSGSLDELPLSIPRR